MQNNKGLQNLISYVQWLINHDKLPKNAIDRYNGIINDISISDKEKESYIEYLQEQNMALCIKHSHLKEHILKLESICFIHGITDLRFLMQKPTSTLFSSANDALDKGYTVLPFDLLKYKNRFNDNDIYASEGNLN